jgi:hypothetical protein
MKPENSELCSYRPLNAHTASPAPQHVAHVAYRPALPDSLPYCRSELTAGTLQPEFHSLLFSTTQLAPGTQQLELQSGGLWDIIAVDVRVKQVRHNLTK